MNKKSVFNILGRIILVEAALLILPTVCAAIYKETDALISFLITIAIAVVSGTLLTLFTKTKDLSLYAKEGFVIVALGWILLSAIGALPFVISREIPRFVDAFFETVSGFSTTGASILTTYNLSRSMFLWRSFTHFIGGMGILVLVMAIIPTHTGRSMHMMRAEMPGPIIGKLVPKIKSTAKILYTIYIVLTLLLVVLLYLGKMSLYESLVYAFGTAGTGGFAITAEGIGAFSPYIQWVITIFMLIFGINFNLYYLLLTKKFISVFKSGELWTYVSIVLVSTGLIAYNVHSYYDSFGELLRTSAFQVSSIVTTTGYATADFNLWPTLSKTIILLLMLSGSCAGSTAGGFKISRVIIMFKTIKAHLKHMLHSRSIETIRFEGKSIDKATSTGVLYYFAIYMICIFVVFFVVSFDVFDFETNMSATISCFNNIGPALGSAGPASNYAAFSDISKLTLSAAMLLGRLEIFPILLLFSPSVWSKQRKKLN